jgi:hypothetical protein
MREDKFSRDEAGAREWANWLGRSEDFGAGEPFAEIRTPYCNTCQHGTKNYVCGPCTRGAA